MDRDIDTEARLHRIHKGLAEGGADIDRAQQGLAVDNRGGAEDVENVAAGFDTADRLFRRERLDDHLAPGGDVVAEGFRIVHPGEGDARRYLNGDQFDAKWLEILQRFVEQRVDACAILRADHGLQFRHVRHGIGHRLHGARIGLHGADHVGVVGLQLAMEGQIDRGVLPPEAERGEPCAGGSRHQ